MQRIDIMLLYLPPYSPDLNPIELSFSTCEFDLPSVYQKYIIDTRFCRESISLS